MKKILCLAVIFSITFFVWIGGSWAEICSKNNYPNPEYSDYNFFIVMENLAEKEVK